MMTSHPFKKDKADLVLRRGPTCINHPFAHYYVVLLHTNYYYSSYVQENGHKPWTVYRHILQLLY